MVTVRKRSINSAAATTPTAEPTPTAPSANTTKKPQTIKGMKAKKNPVDNAQPLPGKSSVWGSDSDYPYWLTIGKVYDISMIFRMIRGHQCTCSMYGYTLISAGQMDVDGAPQDYYEFRRAGCTESVIVFASDIHPYTSFRLSNEEAVKLPDRAIQEAQTLSTLWGSEEKLPEPINSLAKVAAAVDEENTTEPEAQPLKSKRRTIRR